MMLAEQRGAPVPRVSSTFVTLLIRVCEQGPWTSDGTALCESGAWCGGPGPSSVGVEAGREGGAAEPAPTGRRDKDRRWQRQ